MKRYQTWSMLCILALSAACEDPAPSVAAEPTPVGTITARAEPVAAPVAAAAAPTASAQPGDGPAAGAAGEPKTAPTEQQPAAAAAEGGAVVRGAVAQGEPFAAWLETVAPLPANGKGSITVVLEAKNGFKCNDQYPYKFTVGSSASMTPAEKVIRSMQIGKGRSTMSIPVTVGASGPAVLEGEFSFSVCTEDKCLIEKQKLSISVDVKS